MPIGVRLVTYLSAVWCNMDRPGILSHFLGSVSVTQYSPAVFDASVNQINVSSSDFLHRATTTMNLFSDLGAAPFGSRQYRGFEHRL